LVDSEKICALWADVERKNTM